MIIRGAIAAPLALGVFSSLMLVPGYLGFGVSAMCYVLMMVALAGRLPGRGGDDEDYSADAGSDEPSSSLFAGLLEKAKGLPANAATLPALSSALVARVKALLRRDKDDDDVVAESLPLEDAIVADLKDELAAEGVLTEDGAIDADAAPALDEAEEPIADEPEPDLTGRFAFFRKLLRRLAKLPGIAYLLLLTVKVEVSRTQAEEDAELASAAGETREPIGDDDELIYDKPDDPDGDFVDIDEIELGDKPSIADRVLKAAAPLMAIGAPFATLVRKVLRREVEQADALDLALPIEDSPDVADERAAEPGRTLGQMAMRVLVGVLRAVGWTLLIVLGLVVLLADLIITAVRNGMAKRREKQADAEPETAPAPPRRAAPTTPASLYGEYQDAA